jgi:ECF sigma factor
VHRVVRRLRADEPLSLRGTAPNKSRAHLFGIAAKIMRRLIDHARKVAYAKRGGGARKVSSRRTRPERPKLDW